MGGSSPKPKKLKNGKHIHIFMSDKKDELIKIVQIKSKSRLIFPQQVRDVMDIHIGDHLAFIKDKQPGIRVQKVKFEDFNKK